MTQYFILIKTFPPPSARGFLPDVTKGNPEHHQPGSLFKVLQHEGNIISCEKICKDKPGAVIDILESYLEVLNLGEFEILRAIPSPDTSRIVVWQDKKWLREGTTLKVGSSVFICNHKTLPRGTEGTVRYKGNLPAREGIWFGVELAPHYAGEGTTDGYWRRQQFFSCADDCGVFVSIHNLRSNEFAAFRSRDYTSAAEDEEIADIDVSTFAFKMEDRVVWMSDEGPQNGTIKWIGRLPESETEDIVVGVYFDHPVGNGTGRYKGRQLFKTPQWHASLMPPLGLIAFADFYGESNQQSELVDQIKSIEFHSEQGKDSCYVSDTSSASLTRSNEPDIILGSSSDSNARNKPLVPRSPLLPSTLPTSTLPPPQHHTKTPPQHHPKTPHQLSYHFDLGSKVYTVLKDKRYGIIRYIGQHPTNSQRQIAGIEMDVADPSCCTDGEFAGVKLFECPPKRAFFVYLEQCHPDDREF